MPSCSSRDNSAAGPHKPKAGIVDDDLGLEARADNNCPRMRDHGISLFEIGRHHDRTGPPRRGDLIGERIEAILPPRHQNELMAMCCKDTRQFRANTGRGAGNQRDGFHGSLPESVAADAAA